MLNSLKRILSRRRAYRDVFTHPRAETVLADLKRFAHIGQSSFSEADIHGRRQAYIEGRREVVERIIGYLNVSDDDLRRMKEDYPDA